MFKAWLIMQESIGDIDGFLKKFSDDRHDPDVHANIPRGDFRGSDDNHKQIFLSDLPTGAKVVQGDYDGFEYYRVIELPNGQYAIQSKDGSGQWVNRNPKKGQFHTKWNLAANQMQSNAQV